MDNPNGVYTESVASTVVVTFSHADNVNTFGAG